MQPIFNLLSRWGLLPPRGSNGEALALAAPPALNPILVFPGGGGGRQGVSGRLNDLTLCFDASICCRPTPQVGLSGRLQPGFRYRSPVSLLRRYDIRTELSCTENDCQYGNPIVQYIWTFVFYFSLAVQICPKKKLAFSPGEWRLPMTCIRYIH